MTPGGGANPFLQGLPKVPPAGGGKNPLLDLLRRRGKYRPEDFARLHLVEQPDLKDLKRRWLAAIAEAEENLSSERRRLGELEALLPALESDERVGAAEQLADDDALGLRPLVVTAIVE